MGITYRKAPTELTFNVPDTPIQVLLDGRIVGLIRETAGGFAYYPKGAGSKGKGETFLTLDACKRSLKPDPEVCEFCGATNLPIVAVLEADPDQRVCSACHLDPRVPTKEFGCKP